MSYDNDEDWLFAFSLPYSQLSTHRRIPIGFDICSMQLCLFYSLAHCVCDARYTENEYKRALSIDEARRACFSIPNGRTDAEKTGANAIATKREKKKKEIRVKPTSSGQLRMHCHQNTT